MLWCFMYSIVIMNSHNRATVFDNISGVSSENSASLTSTAAVKVALYNLRTDQKLLMCRLSIAERRSLSECA